MYDAYIHVYVCVLAYTYKHIGASWLFHDDPPLLHLWGSLLLLLLPFFLLVSNPVSLPSTTPFISVPFLGIFFPFNSMGEPSDSLLCYERSDREARKSPQKQSAHNIFAKSFPSSRAHSSSSARGVEGVLSHPQQPKNTAEFFLKGRKKNTFCSTFPFACFVVVDDKPLGCSVFYRQYFISHITRRHRLIYQRNSFCSRFFSLLFSE